MHSIDLALAVLRAVADPTRLRILLALDRRPLCVCELVALVEVGQPAVSRHLGILQRAGLVDSQRDGWWIEYRLVDGTGTTFARGVLDGLRDATSADRAAPAFFARVAAVDRKRLGGAPSHPSCATRGRTRAKP